MRNRDKPAMAFGRVLYIITATADFSISISN